MASSLSYSTFDTNQEKNLSVSKIQSQTRRKNKTIKKKPTKKAENFLNSIQEDYTDMDGSGEGLADFEPMSNPVITKAPDEKIDQGMPPSQSQSDEAVSVEAFEAINENDMAQNNYQQYMNTYVPYYSKPSNQANLPLSSYFSSSWFLKIINATQQSTIISPGPYLLYLSFAISRQRCV